MNPLRHKFNDTILFPESRHHIHLPIFENPVDELGRTELVDKERARRFPKLGPYQRARSLFIIHEASTCGGLHRRARSLSTSAVRSSALEYVLMSRPRMD